MNKFFLSLIFGLLFPAISFSQESTAPVTNTNPRVTIQITYKYADGRVFTNYGKKSAINDFEEQAHSNPALAELVAELNDTANQMKQGADLYVLTGNCDYTSPERNKCHYFLDVKCPNGNWGLAYDIGYLDDSMLLEVNDEKNLARFREEACGEENKLLQRSEGTARLTSEVEAIIKQMEKRD